MCTHMKMLHISWPRHMLLPRVNCYFYNCATPIWGIFCPRDISHRVQLCRTPWNTLRGTKYPPNYKSNSSHEGTCPLNISLGTCTRNIFMRVFVPPSTCPRYSARLRVRSVCTRQQVFVAETRRGNMSLQHDPSWLFIFSFLFNLFSTVWPKST